MAASMDIEVPEPIEWGTEEDLDREDTKPPREGNRTDDPDAKGYLWTWEQPFI